ncbi:MAG: hypothetical protein GC134_04200 [Proteobacteria bacterium]|nr:hypothetical protein [Pseudomonadota bacterium]
MFTLQPRTCVRTILAAAVIAVASMSSACAANEQIDRERAGLGLAGNTAHTITDTITFDYVRDNSLRDLLAPLYRDVAPEHLMTGTADIDGDDQPELFVLVEDDAACNNHGCRIDIYRQDGQELTKLASDFGTKVLTAATDADQRKNVIYVQTVTLIDNVTGRQLYDDNFAYYNWQGTALQRGQ